MSIANFDLISSWILDISLSEHPAFFNSSFCEFVSVNCASSVVNLSSDISSFDCEDVTSLIVSIFSSSSLIVSVVNSVLSVLCFLTSSLLVSDSDNLISSFGSDSSLLLTTLLTTFSVVITADSA